LHAEQFLVLSSKTT